MGGYVGVDRWEGGYVRLLGRQHKGGQIHHALDQYFMKACINSLCRV